MFIILLVSNLLLATTISLMVAAIFRRPLTIILQRRFSDEACNIWGRYILFFVGVMSIAIGTRIWEIERYLIGSVPTEISTDQLALELFRTAIATLASNSIFTLLALIGVSIALVAKRNN